MNNMRKNIVLVMVILLCSSSALMAQNSELNSFQGGEVISASEMNANFQLLLDKIKKLEATAVPVGSITAYGGSIDSIPEGWLLCDGQTYEDIKYPELAKILTSKPLTGIGNFTVPDLRGRFLRGIDENLAGKTSSRDPEGIREVGDDQNDALKSHSHSMLTAGNDEGSDRDPVFIFDDDRKSNTHTETTNSTGDSETRPKNVAVYYIIKAE